MAKQDQIRTQGAIHLQQEDKFVVALQHLDGQPIHGVRDGSLKTLDRTLATSQMC
jgi:hypothetical protein